MHFLVKSAKQVTVGLCEDLDDSPEIPDRRHPVIILSYSKKDTEKLSRFVKEAKVTPDEVRVIFNKRKKWAEKEGFIDVQVILEVARGKNCWTIIGEAEIEKKVVDDFRRDYKKYGYFVLSIGYSDREGMFASQWKLVLRKYMEIS